MLPAHQREQVELPVQIPPGVALHALDDTIHGLHEAVAVLAHAVERARLDEAFHGPAVHFVAVQPLAEIIQAGIGLFPTLFHDAFHKVAAHALDRVQAESDLPPGIRRKAAVRNVDIRREYPDAQANIRPNTR